MKRRFTLLAIATFVSTSLMAAWDGTIPESLTFSGEGTEANPYKISSEAELAYLAKTVNAGTNYATKFFEQTADLDLNNKPWKPIGNNSKQFSGIYNGNGFVINNLYYCDSSAQYVGLFGGINNATLKNITLASGFVYGYQYAGGICGIAKGTSIITCCANVATVYGKMERIGGVVAQIDGTTDVNNCINYGLISAYNFAGGVVGGRNKSYNQTVSYCINVGQVFTMRSSGNLYGMNNNGYGTTKCYYDNQINASGGWTFNGSSKETENDRTGEMEGLSTERMTNESLNGFSNSIWQFTTGMYPRLKVNSGKDAIVLAATPIILSSGDKADNVTKDFSISSEWTSGNTSNISISNGIANIKKSTAVVLIATKGNYTKKVYLKTNKNGATAIGSEKTPLTIENEEELIKFREAVNNYGIYKGCANYDGFKGIHFKVTVDIELSNWTTPIGTHNSFKGVFDGNHRNIKNVNVDQYSKNIAIVGGLFGCASYGEIKNINITSGTVSGIQFVGGLCGSTFRELIKNCTANCEVSTYDKNNVGGVIGVSKGYSRYEDCINNGNVSGTQYVAGVIASCNTTDTVIRCKNYGEISGTNNVAGVCGNAAGTDCLYSFCENHNSITCSKATDPNSGGIISAGAGSGTIVNCINTGSVIATGTNAGYCGGIIGHPGGSFAINQCLNIGTITGNATGTIGGILGATDGTISITNSYNAGIITGGGIVGSLKGTCTKCINVGESTTSSNSFHDNQLFSGSGLKTSQMVGTALQENLGTEDWTYTDYMYPMIKTLESSNYMILAASTITLDANDSPNNVNKKFHIGTAYSVEWKCDQANIVSFSSNNAYLSKPTTGDENVVVTVNVGKLEKSFNLTIKKGESGLLQPDINWSLDNTIFTYGDKLTTAMQNATESHDYNGHFEYNFDENHFLSVGGHNLTATFIPAEEEENNIAVKVASIAITVSKATPTINWSVQDGLEIDYGTDAEEILKTAEATLNGVNVSDEGTFYYTIPTLTGGSKEIKVIFIGDNYESNEETRSITVTPATPTIAWADPAPITYGTALSDLQLGAVSGVEGTFSYCEVIDNADVALPTDGILNAGTHTLKAIFDSKSENYKDGEYETVELIVNPIVPEITWHLPWDKPIVDTVYGTILLENDFYASVADEYKNFGSIVYTDSYSEDIRGILSAGTHTVTATFEPSNNNYDTNTATATVKVNKAQPTITWNSTAENMTITYGEGLSATQLNATVTPAEAGQIVYSFDAAGTDIATIGRILDQGSYSVFATVAESDNYKKAQEASPVNIQVNAAKLTLEWTPEGVTYGATPEEINSNIKTAKITFGGEDVAGTPVYDIPSPLVAGKQIIKLSFTPSSSNYKPIIDSVRTINVAKATPEIEWNDQQHLTYGASEAEIMAALENATAKFGNTIVTGDYAYTLPLTTDLQAGADNITAEVEFIPTGEDANNFEPANATINIVVDKADPTITWEIADEDKTFTYGTGRSDKQLNAETNGEGEIVYTDDDEAETILAIEAVLDAGTHTITATLPESSNYNEATATATIIVNQAETSIEWETPAPIAANTPISAAELNATANVDGNFAYTLNGEDAEGQMLGVGNYTITATFTPNSANYKGSTATITLQVVQAAAEITWATPEAITYGTAISSVQLNATSEIDGTFYYKPDDGAILPAGDTSISVIFVPDSPDYGRALDTVKLTVNKAELSVSVADVTVNKGDAIPEFVISYDGFVNGENESVLTTAPTATCAATTGEVGEFEIVVSGGESNNYNFTYTKGKLTVVETIAPAITWAEPAAITYGTLISASILNATANVDGTFAYSVNVGDTLKAGVHELTATFTPASGAEAITSTVKLTVNKANLTVSVADVTVNQGDEMPKFNIEYKGFVLDETIANLTAVPSAKVNATTDQAGTFDIVLSGGESANYNFEYKNGKLTVVAKEDTTAITGSEVKISVYPNPTADVFFVETDSNADYIYIYNMTGKMVATEANVGKTRIDLANEPQGTYFVKVGEKTIKVLKF